MAKRKLRKGVIPAFGVIICLIIGGVFVFTLPEKKELKENDNSTTTTKSEEKKQERIAKLTLVGDFLFESPFYESVNKGYDKNNYFKLVKPYFEDDDITLGNMEVVIGNEDLPVSGDGYNFCAPTYIGNLVSSLDFQVLSTANNHAFDRGLDGITSTLNYFKKTNIKTVGTFLNEEDKMQNRIIDANGIKFGFLAYTYGTNMKVSNDAEPLINKYRNSITKTFSDTEKEKIKNDVEKIKAESDVVVVMMHWGNEFTFTQNNEQKEVANYLNSIGVDIIYGSHSHSIQPIEVIGDTHKTLVYYSLGNFVSNDDDIARTPKGEETFDNAYQFGLLSTLNVKMDDEGNISIDNVKAEPIVNYFDSSLNNWLLIPYDKYTETYEKSHFRYNLGLTKEFINNTFTSVIDEKYR